MNDLERLRYEYKERRVRLAESDLYSLFNQASLFMMQQRQRVLLKVLKSHGFQNLSELSVLEVGCGSGGILKELILFGANPLKIFGIDLLYDRLGDTHKIIPCSGIVNADGQRLPFPEKSFDLVIQYTAISSILDQMIRKRVAADMLRTVAPGGLVISYDFWLNPTNPQTRGIRPAEIKRLFPNCFYEFHKVTLAPPITRRLIPGAWGLALFLESLKIFNTHYLVAIQLR